MTQGPVILRSNNAPLGSAANDGGSPIAAPQDKEENFPSLAAALDAGATMSEHELSQVYVLEDATTRRPVMRGPEFRNAARERRAALEKPRGGQAG